MTPPLKVLIVDASDTLIRGDGTAVPGMADAIATIRKAGIRVAVVGNEADAAIVSSVKKAGVEVDLVVGRTTAKVKKPSPRFCEIPASTFGATPAEMIYVGDNDATDAFCAVNGGVLYLSALWANGDPKYGLPLSSPDSLVRFVSRFLMAKPRWYWTLNKTDKNGTLVSVRGLLHARKSGTHLKDVLKFNQLLRVEGVDYWNFLFNRLLTALVLDGTMKDVDTWTWVPGSKGQAKPERFGKSFDVASKLFRAKYVSDLLVRHKPAAKMAFARAKNEPVTFQNTVQTLLVNPAERTNVVGKHVLLVDDFCTEGLSFEWCRRLLYCAGARAVTCVAIGRYRLEYRVHTLKAGRTIDPWVPCTLTDADFDVVSDYGVVDSGADDEAERLIKLFPADAPHAAR